MAFMVGTLLNIFELESSVNSLVESVSLLTVIYINETYLLVTVLISYLIIYYNNHVMNINDKVIVYGCENS